MKGCSLRNIVHATIIVSTSPARLVRKSQSRVALVDQCPITLVERCIAPVK